MLTQMTDVLSQYVSPESTQFSHWNGTILTFQYSRQTQFLQANRYYFGHPEWSRNYLSACHQDEAFQDRWQAVIGSWQDKIVVDIGCGPGNVYRALHDRCGVPYSLIGVDVSQGGLQIAQELGYTAVLADAQQLPFIDGFADIVTLNATLHHCDDMEAALREGARLVRPGGLLVIDHDPQRTMWGDNPIADLIWKVRLPLYRMLKRGGHSTTEEQFWSTATEAHHRPGDGVTPELFQRVLTPLGFTVHLYPHNRTVGRETLLGERGQAEWKIRFAQRLSGVDPDSAEGALVLMCVARRSN
ncbi:class I SAM-dependent methyltransferase [Egbenema bharatensis]|uniref:class I SAM-dependent methyltransferase n=1 Tax=Egbenema bharatensis TaxID=3463334 RepID=UPI003A8AAE8A